MSHLSARDTRIRSVTVHVLESPLAEAFAYSQAWYDRRGALLVEIVTEGGIVGWGEAFGPARINAAVVIHLAPLIVGQDALAVEAHWEKLYNALRDHGQKGGAVQGLSAIDIALWDIRGRCLGVPIHRLLGGPIRTRVDAYATGLYRRRRDDHDTYLAEEATDYLERGFRAMKLKIGFGVDEDVRLTRGVHAVLGGRARLMVDANHAYNVTDALRYARATEELDLGWLEEPVVPEDIAGYAALRGATSVPIAGGEAEFTRYGFRELITRRAVDILQPDVLSAGGITETKKIVDMAAAFGMRSNPHVWGTGIGLAAALHLIAVIPHVPPALHPVAPLLEFDCTEHPIRQRILQSPLEPLAGSIEVPDAPGLGIEIDRDAVSHFTIGSTTV